MKAALFNGKILEPRSLEEATDRHRQLVHEIARIQMQLAVEWRENAQHALKVLRAEEKQLTDWIAARNVTQHEKGEPHMTQKEQDKHEMAVVEQMSVAVAIADKLFEEHSNVFAEQEIYDYLQEADEDEFVADLKSVIVQVKNMHKPPTPERVFGLFDRIWNDDEE